MKLQDILACQKGDILISEETFHWATVEGKDRENETVTIFNHTLQVERILGHRYLQKSPWLLASVE